MLGTYIFRAYHALPPLTRKSDGLPVGAVPVAASATCCGSCSAAIRSFGLAADAFRGDLRPFLEFVPQRDLSRVQGPSARAAGGPAPAIPIIREATRAFNVACIEQEGYEADDLIATYARQAAKAGAHVSIISSDKDLMQLVTMPNVVWYDTMKDKRIGLTRWSRSSACRRKR
jgi:DNA polymerase-1